MKNTIYLGWDSREQVAYEVAKHSILSRTNTENIEIHPLILSGLKDRIDRPIEIRDGRMFDVISQAPMATEFAISRFCVPFLQKEGWALFVDCDIICTTDIQEIFDLRDDSYAVMCVKHKQKETGEIKMDNQIQTYYNRKNWSSCMLINCSHPANKRLTLSMLNNLPGRHLHAFSWLKDDEIGELPHEWNYLVGVDEYTDQPQSIYHFTLGTPNIEGYENSLYAEKWFKEESKALQKIS